VSFGIVKTCLLFEIGRTDKYEKQEILTYSGGYLKPDVYNI